MYILALYSHSGKSVCVYTGAPYIPKRELWSIFKIPHTETITTNPTIPANTTFLPLSIPSSFPPCITHPFITPHINARKVSANISKISFPIIPVMRTTKLLKLVGAVTATAAEAEKGAAARR